MLTDMMLGRMFRGKWGYAAVNARALLPNLHHSQAANIFSELTCQCIRNC